MLSKRRAIVGSAAALAIAGGISVAASGGHGDASRIAVSDSACASGWSAHSGRTVFTVENTAPHDFFSVQLVSGADPVLAVEPISPANAARAANAEVFGQVSLLAPQTEVPLDAVLPPGRYFVRCLDSNGNTFDSPVTRVGGGTVRSGDGPVAGARPYSPVTPNQLAFAMQSYRTSVQPVLSRLAADTDRLARAVRAGRFTLARTLWLPAHLDYARLGVAYGTFGRLDGEIDGRPLGLLRGAHDPGFRGFLRLEYGLWHGQSRQGLVHVASALDAAVHGLVKAAGSTASVIWVNTDLPLRAHEILENTLQFELTAETDEGSNTNLATAWANVQGESIALGAVVPLLRSRDPRLLASTRTASARLEAAFAAYRRPDGAWERLGALTLRQRERLDSATGALLEQLEKIPDELRPALFTASSGD